MADVLGGSVAVASEGEASAAAARASIGRESASSKATGSWGAEESTEPLREGWSRADMRWLSVAGGDKGDGDGDGDGDGV